MNVRSGIPGWKLGWWVGVGLALGASAGLRADVERVNVGVYGGMLMDIAALNQSGTSVVFAAVECNRGVFRWRPDAGVWSSVTYPDIVGSAVAVEDNPAPGHASDIYGIIRGTDGADRAYASSSAGASGTWSSVTGLLGSPAVLTGHTSGMYAGMWDGGLYYNAGGTGDAFVRLHTAPGRLLSVSPFSSNCIFVTVGTTDSCTNLLRLDGSPSGGYTETVLTLPTNTPSGVGTPTPKFVAADPSNSNRLILAGSDYAAFNPQVYESLDGGLTWGRGWDHNTANRFPGGYTSFVKFDHGRLFVSPCALLEGSDTWTSSPGSDTPVGTLDGGSTIVHAHFNDPALAVDPNNPDIVYFSTDWAIASATCTVASASWGMGTEIATNNGIAGVVLNNLDFFSINATSKVVWVAAKSGIGRSLHYNPADPASTVTPSDWIFPIYPGEDGHGSGGEGAPAAAIAIHPTNSAIVLAGYHSGRIFRSADADGNSSTNIHWSWVFQGRDHPEVFGTTGDDIVISSIGFVPSSPTNVYMGGYRSTPPLTNGGVYCSFDTGVSWSCVASGFPVNVLYVSDDAVWAGTDHGLRARQSPTHWWAPLSGVSLDNENVLGLAGTTIGATSTVYVATQGGVYKGVKIEPSSGGFDAWGWTNLTARVGAVSTNFNAVTVDPANAAHAYVAAVNYIYETADGGVTWSVVSGTGTPAQEQVRVLRYDDLLMGTDDGLFAFKPASPIIDSDGDGLSDFEEIHTYGTNPGLRDTDSDGLSDGEEVHDYGTDPTKADTDGDGFADGDEVDASTDPTDTYDYCSTDDLGRVNLGVYGGLVRDIATLTWSGRSHVYAALDGNRGIFRWQGSFLPRARWIPVTWPDIVGKGRAVEANPASGHSNELYAIICGTDNVHRLYASEAHGGRGTWTNCPSVSNPDVLAGHTSGMYVGTFDGRICYNAGTPGAGFTELYNMGRQIASIAPVSVNRIFVTCTNMTPGVVNLYRLDRSLFGLYIATAMPLPAATASGVGQPIVTLAGVDPANSNRVIVAGSDQAAADPQVYESLDGGLTWGRCWERAAGGTSNFPGAYPQYVKFNHGRLFISGCALADGSDAWTSALGSETTVGISASGSSRVYAHVNSGALDVDPLDPTLVYHDTDWALCAATCTVSCAWSIGTEIGANYGMAAVVLNDMDFQSVSATNKWLWVAAKSGFGRALHFNPADPASTSMPHDWIFPIYPCTDGAPPSSVAMQPGHPEVVLAANGAGKVYRSADATNMTDTSIHWTQVFNAQPAYTNVFHTTQSDVWLTSLGFVPSSPNEVYFGGYCWSSPVTYGGVFYSTNAGVSWSCVASGFPVNALFVSDRAVWAGVGSQDCAARGLRAKQSATHWWAPTSGMRFDSEVITGIAGTTLCGTSTVYLASQGGVYKGVLPPSGSAFSDWVWSDLTTAVGASDTHFTSATIDPDNASHAYVASGNCIYETLDGGSSWFLVTGTGTAWHEDVRVLCYDDLLLGTDDGLYAAEETLPFYYVDAASASPSAPYSDWEHAALTIQDAVRVAPKGATVYVRAGTYDAGGDAAPGGTLVNRLCVTNAITIRGVDGRDSTIVVGAGPNGPAAMRCAYLASGVTLRGLTLRDGHTASAGDAVTEQSGGGAFLNGGGTLIDCCVTGCSATVSGGGVYCAGGGEVQQSIVVTNTAGANGAGVCLRQGGALRETRVWFNVGTGSSSTGGGVHCENGGQLVNCEVAGNSSAGKGGGLSLVRGGTASFCTIAQNRADTGGGVLCQKGGALTNCIAYFNHRLSDSLDQNWNISGGGGTRFDFCCTTPLPPGVGSVTGDPCFLDLTNRNYGLRYGSPCIDTGRMPDVATTDLGGTARPIEGNYTNYPDCDMGAWEYDPKVTDSDSDGMMDDWEHTYALNPLSAADAATDADGDGASNLSEYVAGTNPTSLGSCFRITQAGLTPSGFVLQWTPVAGRIYTVTRMTGLSGAGTTVLNSSVTDGTYTDTEGGGGQGFYRVSVRLMAK